MSNGIPIGKIQAFDPVLFAALSREFSGSPPALLEIDVLANLPLPSVALQKKRDTLLAKLRGSSGALSPGGQPAQTALKLQLAELSRQPRIAPRQAPTEYDFTGQPIETLHCEVPKELGPVHSAIEQPNGELWVAPSWGDLQRFSSSGEPLAPVSILRGVTSITAHPSGVVALIGSGRLRVLAADGSLLAEHEQWANALVFPTAEGFRLCSHPTDRLLSLDGKVLADAPQPHAHLAAAVLQDESVVYGKAGGAIEVVDCLGATLSTSRLPPGVSISQIIALDNGGFAVHAFDPKQQPALVRVYDPSAHNWIDLRAEGQWLVPLGPNGFLHRDLASATVYDVDGRAVSTLARRFERHRYLNHGRILEWSASDIRTLRFPTR